MILLAAILGGLSNAIRGGLGDLPQSKAINHALFAAFIFYATHNAFQAVFAGLMMWAGSSFGWGRYVGAVGGWEDKELKEVWFIDAAIMPLKDWMQLWGFAGLTLRGMLWGACLGLAFMSAWPILAGATMGAVYYFVLKWLGATKGWPASEFVFGAILWVGCVL